MRPPRDYLEFLYCRERHSLETIAGMVNAPDADTVRDWLVADGLIVAPSAEPQDPLPRDKLLCPNVSLLHHRYVELGWTIKRTAKVFGVDPKIARRWLDEAQIPVRTRTAPPGSVLRQVVRYEELPYDTTGNGRVLTATVAILDCGHKAKVYNKANSSEFSFTTTRTCPACTKRNKTNGG